MARAQIDIAPLSRRGMAMYLAMLLAAIALFVGICHLGQTVFAPLTPAGPHSPVRNGDDSGLQNASNALLHVLLALVAVVAGGRMMGAVCRRLGQPPVIGEVLWGICLGPSVLGWIAPSAQVFILPQTVAPYLAIIAQLGVILYMFQVGLELNASLLRQRMHVAIAVSHASIIVPFLLGGVLALALYQRLSDPEVPFASFALFLGISMSITAFPVLARILSDRGLSRTPLGITALTCAAIDDATAWCLLAVVVGVAQARLGQGLIVTILALAYLALMLFAIRPLARRWIGCVSSGPINQSTIALLLLGVLCSAVATEAIGIHAIFGAFLLGAVVPHDSALARSCSEKFADIVAILLLPGFFAYTGMRTQIALVSGWENWLICGIIIIVATLGKFGGSWLAASLAGMGRRDAAALGILMNTRGLMELIVLNIGLDLKVISPTLFTMLVLMALATTLATSPILHRIMPSSRLQPTH